MKEPTQNNLRNIFPKSLFKMDFLANYNHIWVINPFLSDIEPNST